jgi:hypothetical protein
LVTAMPTQRASILTRYAGGGLCGEQMSREIDSLDQ